MKKEIKEIYLLMLMLFILNLFILAISSIFTSSITTPQLLMFGILAIVVALSFSLDVTLAMIISSFVIFVFATVVFYFVYIGRITGLTQFSYYIWFLALPLGALLGGTLRKKLLAINRKVEEFYEDVEKYGMKNVDTSFKNKSEFFNQLNIRWEIYKRKKIPGSTILIDITDFKILKDTLQGDNINLFYRYMAKEIVDITRLEDEKYFLEEGKFGIILPATGVDELVLAKARIKAQLKKSLEHPAPELKIKNIPFKISSVTICDEIDSAPKAYQALEKGLEYDV